MFRPVYREGAYRTHKVYYYGRSNEFPGSTVLLKEEWVADGEDGVPPELEEVEGYTFSGWGSFPYTNVKSSRSLHAGYHTGTVKTHKAEFIDYDGTLLINPQFVVDGGRPSVPYTPQREGLTFLGWNREFCQVTGPMVIKARYKRGAYDTRTIRFYGKMTSNQSNWTLLKEEHVLVGTNATPPSLPVNAGYEFQEWDGNYKNIQTNQNIYARYARLQEPAKRYVVGFCNENGTILLKLEQVLEGGNATPPGAPEKEGYVFAGWSQSHINVRSDLQIMAAYRRGSIESDSRYREIREALSGLKLPKSVEASFMKLARLLIEEEETERSSRALLISVAVSVWIKTQQSNCLRRYIGMMCRYHLMRWKELFIIRSGSFW